MTWPYPFELPDDRNVTSILLSSFSSWVKLKETKRSTSSVSTCVKSHFFILRTNIRWLTSTDQNDWLF